MVQCPEHKEPLTARELWGVSYSECGQCKLAVIARSALNRLRNSANDLPDIDAKFAENPLDSASSRQVPVGRKCPQCGKSVIIHTFGGGNIKVESCEECTLVLLKRPHLIAIVKEARDGIEMSDEAKATLHQERMLAAGNRYFSAEMGLSTVFLVVIVAFFRITLRTGFNTTFVIAGALIALLVGGFVYRKHQKDKAEAAAKMERLAAAEIHRQEQRDLKTGSEPHSPAPGAIPVSASFEGPVRRSNTQPISSNGQGRAKSNAPRRCPFCRAQVPAGTTHCKECDSDFG